MVHTRSQRYHTHLPGDVDYFHGKEYNDDLLFNSDYNRNDVELGMIIANIELEKNDVIQLYNQNNKYEEATFIGVLLNNTMYLHWLMENKKLFADEDEVICIKKVDNKNQINEVWTRSHRNGIFQKLINND